MKHLAKLDRAHVWHPFTQMKDWLRREPIVIVCGKGAVIEDQRGRQYLDGNSSIWTNLHGHRHPQIDRAIKRQLGKVAHSSALGLANEPASLLAKELVQAANPKLRTPTSKRPARSALRVPRLEKVFFSDDGSTALEVALKLAYEFTRRTRGPKSKPRFLSLAGAYHGDTIGAVSLGHIDLFHQAYGGMLFKSDKVMAPYCYRCPFNRAKPERADAREYRKCNWECVGKVEQALEKQAKRGNPYAGFVFEPVMQGAAGLIPQPAGWLQRVTDLARGHGALLIADEVMTGFGRTGILPVTDGTPTRIQPAVGPATSAAKRGTSEGDGSSSVRRGMEERRKASAGDRQDACPALFASHSEGVQPDFLCLAKGLTGGYLPMAATLTTQSVFDAFLGEYEEFRTFFHGHSYTANQLGAAAGLASLEILQSEKSIQQRTRLAESLKKETRQLWELPQVGDIRQTGCVVGVELVKDWRIRKPFELRERAGIRVCEALAKRGVLTRPIGSVIVLMPPYCTTPKQVVQMLDALMAAITETIGK